MSFHILRNYFEVRKEIIIIPKTDPISPTEKKYDFDPNLPELRKRIINVVNSNSFGTSFINPEALYSVNFKNDLISPPSAGSFNVYIWNNHYTQSIDLLKAKFGFPYNPCKKSFTHSLKLINRNRGFGQRVFGYIIPPISGEYSIEVTFSGSVEIWLSPDDQPSNAIKQQLNSPQSSHSVNGIIGQVINITTDFVVNKKQYLEIMHVSSVECLFVIKWKRPEAKDYQQIEMKCLLPYVNDFGPKVISETYSPKPLPLHDPSPKVKQFFHIPDDRNDIYLLPTVDISSIGSQENNSIPLCEYQLSYVEKSSIKDATRLQLVYTRPDHKLYRQIRYLMITRAVISPSGKEKLIRIFMDQLRSSYKNVRLSRFINMERLVDPTNGDLYLIEVLVNVDGLSDRELLISEYVVLGHKSLPQDILCRPTAMKIHRNTFIHFLVTHRNLPQMLREFVQNMERIYVETGDEDFGVIIVNYESPPINATTLMLQSKLKHWSIIEMDGPWEKTAAINLGIDSVTNPDHIIFTVDLYLYIPSHLPDTIRKHTFQGYSGFVPIVFYFGCCISFNVPFKGFYSMGGFGLVGLFKSDWEKVGGMDTTKFKGKWGYEDNDLADRILANGYHLFRLPTRDFYHQDHSTVQLWS